MRLRQVGLHAHRILTTFCTQSRVDALDRQSFGGRQPEASHLLLLPTLPVLEWVDDLFFDFFFFGGSLKLGLLFKGNIKPHTTIQGP